MKSWYEPTLNDQVWPKNTHGRDTDAGLCGSIGSTEAGENDGGCASHRAEEGLYVGVNTQGFRTLFESSGLTDSIYWTVEKTNVSKESVKDAFRIV